MRNKVGYFAVSDIFDISDRGKLRDGFFGKCVRKCVSVEIDDQSDRSLFEKCCTDYYNTITDRKKVFFCE